MNADGLANLSPIRRDGAVVGKGICVRRTLVCRLRDKLKLVGHRNTRSTVHASLPRSVR
jgi:hypothetical protein